MSETASTFAIKNLNNKDSSISIGKPILHGEIKLINETLYINSKTQHIGELKNGIIEKTVLIDGFYETQDKACNNKNDQVIIKGRKDKIFISGGKNISTERIKKIVNSIVKDYYLLIHPHEKWGESYSLFINGIDTRVIEDVEKTLRQKLHGELSPFTITFMDGTEKFIGIKPSQKELMNLIPLTLRKQIND